MSSKTSFSASTAQALKKFLWFCSGADIAILEREECSTERNKYAGIGATIFLTAVLASFSGGYALFTVFRHYPQSISFGALWSILIFNLDRYIVLSMRAERTNKINRVLKALPRFALAVLISIVVSVPLELKIFDKEISYQLESNIATIRPQLEEKYRADLGRIDADVDKLKQEIAQEQAKDDDFHTQMELEGKGIKAPGTTGKCCQGQAYKAEKEYFDHVMQPALGALKEKNFTRIAELEKDRKTRIDEQEDLINRKVEVARKTNGLLAQLDAMHELTSHNGTMFVAFYLLVGIFLVLETAPVVVKLLSNWGPYEAICEAREAEIVKREERRAADAEAKANNDAQYQEEIQRNFRNTEIERVKTILQNLSSDPKWLADKSQDELAVAKRLRERISQMIDGILPVNDPELEREHGRGRTDYASLWSARRLARIAAFAILFLLVLGGFWLLWLRPKEHSAPRASEAYIWKDSVQGNVYLAVQSPTLLDQALLLSGEKDIRLQLTDIKAPLAPSSSGSGLQTTVFTVNKRITSHHPLVDLSSKPVVYLFGEIHLGKSQVIEAERICKLIQEEEIDAIFLEQPDDLQFNWSRFKQLEDAPHPAILGLQYQMRTDADRVPKIRLGRYDRYFREGDITTPGGEKQIEDRVEHDYGKAAVQQFRTAATEQSHRVNDSPAGRAYAESQYISAVDYLYVMTNLLKMEIPFYNVDSERLRRGFGSDDGLDQRERVIAQRIAEIVNTNGFHHVIYICGAFHLKGLVTAFGAIDLQPSIKLDALDPTLDAFLKKRIAALVNTDYVIAQAQQMPPSNFKESSDLLLTYSPSDRLVTHLQDALEKEGFGTEDVVAFRRDFINKYTGAKLRGRDRWFLTLVNNTGEKAVVLSWNKRNRNSLDIEYARAPTDAELKRMSIENTLIHKIEYGDELQAKEVNEGGNDLLLAIVRKNLTHYSVTFGDGIHESPTFTDSDIVRAINDFIKEKPRSVIILNAKELGQGDFDALVHNCREQQTEINPRIPFIVFDAPNEQSTFFSKKLVFQGPGSNIEPIEDGKYKGWFGLRLNFASETKKWAVRVIIKNWELAVELFRNLSLIFAKRSHDLMEMSPGDILAKALREVGGIRLSEEQIVVRIEEIKDDNLVGALETKDDSVEHAI